VFPPTSIGGVERYLMYLCESLKRHDFSLAILTRYYPPLSRKRHFPAYSVYRVGFNPFPYTTRRYISEFVKLTGDFFSFSFLGFFDAIKFAKEYEIVHSQLGFESDLSLGAKMARKLKKKFVVTVHGRFGSEPEDLRIRPSLMKELRRANFTIVNRKQTYDFLSGEGLDKIILLRNPIPVTEYKRPSSFKRKSRIVRVLFIGRLSYRRGVHIAIKSFAHAVMSFPKIELCVIGEGPMKASLVSYVKKRGLQDKVKFLGKQLQIKSHLWHNDIFLAPSPIANSPSLSLREAMASGLAVIATDVEETKDVVLPYKTGLLVQSSYYDVGEAILELAQNEKLRRTLSLSAVKFAERNFDVALYTKELRRIYITL
jgi:glycosyltransferase involved in cell wall biosynthesis